MNPAEQYCLSSDPVIGENEFTPFEVILINKKIIYYRVFIFALLKSKFFSGPPIQVNTIPPHNFFEEKIFFLNLDIQENQ